MHFLCKHIVANKCIQNRTLHKTSGWVGGVIMSSQGFTDLTTYNGLLEGDRKRERTRERQRRRETESGIDRWGRETERKWKRGKRKRERTIKRVGGRGNRSLLVRGYGTHQMVRRFMVFASSHLLLGVAAARNLSLSCSLPLSVSF